MNKKTINELVKEAHQTAKEKGWYDNDNTNLPEKLMLCVCELSEAMEEYRNHKQIDQIYFIDGKPEGIPIELADVLIRIFDLCGRYEIDIEKAVKLKMGYNKIRGYRHGNKKS